MSRKRLLLAAALTTAVGCGGKKQHVLHGNPKGSHYDTTPVDAGFDAPPPPDAEPDESTLPGNPKGAFYDDGLAKPPGT